MLGLFFRQVWTLTVKNLLIVLVRPTFTTTLRALVLPVIFVAFISFAKNLFIPPAEYGIGSPTPVRSLGDALGAVSGSRDKVVFVHNGLTGGDIEQVINRVAEPVRTTQKQVQVLSSENELRELCRTSLRGVSSCVAAAVFYSSPTEGPGGHWNYSIRTDGALGVGIKVDQRDNDQETYLLPFQHSIDWAIAQANASSEQNALPNELLEYPFTSLTQAERKDQIRTRYMGAIIDIIAVAIFIEVVGVTYQLTGLIAMERELGMSQLIDCMMPSHSHWQSQAARFISAHLALDIVYGPAWVIAGIILKYGVFRRTSAGILVIYNILAGLSLASFSVFGASFFRKAQLSGISIVIACLLLGVIAQLAPASSSGAVGILSLLFPPMNFVYFFVLMARWERQNLPTNLVHAAPNSSHSIPGIAFWILLIVQIIVYPVLAAVVERALYGTTSKSRKILNTDDPTALSLNGFTKTYRPSWFYRNVASRFGSTRQSVYAVNDLSMNVRKGEIVVLLGANGSGKSTTLDAISGLTTISSGSIDINYGGSGGRFGLCPQKNVLWDTLTVKEHVKIFNKLKSTGEVDKDDELLKLLDDCDLSHKVNARSKTLSGGQKRKVQLAMMLTGGSSICAVDEVSSGIDPIARAKIWDILLAARGSRTILLTTHFLDEADLLADHITILSKGVLRAQGSSVELKDRLGSGYRIHVLNVPGSEKVTGSEFENIPKEVHFDDTVYTVKDSATASRLMSMLEQKGITEYRVSGPTIEDVFLKVAEELDSNSVHEEISVGQKGTIVSEKNATDGEHGGLQLLTGKRISMLLQSWYLFRKRATILRRNPVPYLAALLIPVIAAGLVTLFLKDATKPTCSGESTYRASSSESLASQNNFKFVIGPSDMITPSVLENFVSSLSGFTKPAQKESLDVESHFHLVNSLAEFDDYISTNYANVTPGGFYLGDTNSAPTFAWKGDNGEFPLSAFAQNALDNIITGTPIHFQFQYFDIPWQSGAGKTLQLIVYFGLAMAVYPALFSLYPTVEQLKNVRALHFSNGVRGVSLWLAYLTFDFCIVVASSVLAIIIFRAVSDVWYHAEYLFVVFFLYGLCSTILAYVVSLFSKSQLAAFAIAAGGQCVLFLIYFIAYMSVLTYAPTQKVDDYLQVTHFTIGIISPTGNLLRALFTALNTFSILCRGREIASYPGEITLYGGPILYLILQSLVLFGLLLWVDRGPTFSMLRRTKNKDEEEKNAVDGDVAAELARVADSTDGLRVLHLSKKFKKFVAVDDVTFGVPKSQVFALLGPNGAGKTTTITLIRGDMQPSDNGGDILVNEVSVLKNRAAARSHLGVCPQFDAMDQMTVIEHLEFYARIRGVPDVKHNVTEVIRAVGLTSFQDRMATKLSGGNKRKLSLGIALMGNPQVLLLDEPSSGMDAASKRVMWKTLASVVPGRSIVLTTHSMEEADALATRAGIMAKRMLALGTTDYLRKKYGNKYHVHLVHSRAPHTTDADMARIREWVQDSFPSAVIEQKTYHGQVRFSVPATAEIIPSNEKSIERDKASVTADKFGRDVSDEPDVQRQEPKATNNNIVSKLFSKLEQGRALLGIQYYSVSQTTLDQVFLTIVGQHRVEEENSG
ncbi:putative ABC transporter [Aspergillus clavatus NRRL 1]|uniref:ABC transporter, putative n=1 Tax=Aspergillus clavatus (strain ATCC 1007 / CBS 513.65 / DSM 816 / NCTC 3887 / NRRL 1 / QM 1276 / 107) TaxID=344612 RepID=A1CAB3_ASPCL|nr:ABC transporter, putative [Aspergillus clavatus NRRL 1]EAW12681.1 ABC transporter, putative [Aspergillus clavatus NRRL 1]